MDQDNKPQIIYFKDLLFAAFYQWKKILLVALVFALVLGGMQLLDRNPVSDTPENTEQVAALETKLANTQLQVDTLESYLQESIVLNMDPYCYYSASADLFVQTDYQIQPGMEFQNVNPAPAMVRCYLAELTGNETLEQVAQQLQLPAARLSEAISGIVQTDGSYALTLTVVHATPEGAAQILNALLSQQEAIQSKVSAAIGTHTVSISAVSVTTKNNPALVKQRTDAEARLSSLYGSLGSVRGELEALLSPAEEAGSNSLKMAIIGAVLGVLLSGFVALLAHMGSTKVYSGRTLKNQTGIRILGCVAGERKRFFVDRWLRKLEGRSQDRQQLAVAATAIRNYCDAQSHILVLGEDQALPALLKETGLVVSCCQSPDAAALQLLPNCTHVVLVAQCGVSTYGQVEQIMELVRDHGKQLLGCVLVDG